MISLLFIQEQTCLNEMYEWQVEKRLLFLVCTVNLIKWAGIFFFFPQNVHVVGWMVAA